MKYLTPDLLFKLQSSDEVVVDEATSSWEQACESYNAYVATIHPGLPDPIKEILDKFCLHDAKVLWMSPGMGRFVLAARLDGTHDQGVVLIYKLTAPPRKLLHSKLARNGKPHEWVLYDEIAEEDGHFSHSILFTGGREIRLEFESLDVIQIQKQLVPSINHTDEEDTSYETDLCEMA